MRGSPAEPGSPLTSKPTWSNHLRVIDRVGFFIDRIRRSKFGRPTRTYQYGQVQIKHGPAGRPGGRRLRAAEDGTRAQVSDRSPERGDAGDHAARRVVACRAGAGPEPPRRRHGAGV